MNKTLKRFKPTASAGNYLTNNSVWQEGNQFITLRCGLRALKMQKETLLSLLRA